MAISAVEKKLDEFLSNNDLDAYLQFDDSSNTNHRYLSGFEASDNFAYLRQDKESILLVPQLEKGLANKTADVDTVRSMSEFATDDIRDNVEAEANLLSEFLTEYSIQRVGVPRDFDLYLANYLESDEISVNTISDIFIEARIQKSDSEIEKLEEAQATTQEAMALAENILRESQIQDEVLHYEGEVLTAERLQAKLRIFLMEHGCTLDETIVACGPPGADPHYIGSGPLKPHEPILFDIYPEHSSGYWGDMSRTFVKGTPSDKLEEMYAATLEAFKIALDVLSNGAGVTGGDVHEAVCDVFESKDYPTIREGDIDEGFLHSTGHGIGLDLHEPPRLVSDAGELKPGTVLTVEPGLYDSDIGGVRVEDMVVVTEDGFRNLNDYHTNLSL